MQFTQQQLQTLEEYRPVQRSEQSLMRAAVAIILRQGAEGLEFMMMQRARHENDPWSGQMSFPGGKIDPQDNNSPKAAAIRETKEEVNIDLSEDDYLGQLDDLYGLKVDNQYSVHVASYVFMPKRELSPQGNYEVEDIVWLPISYLDDAKNAIDFYHPKNPEIRMPAVMINADKEQVLWGLSLRILGMFYELLQWPMSVLNEKDVAVYAKIENSNLDSRKLDATTQKIFARGVKNGRN